MVKQASQERLCGLPETQERHLYAEPLQKLYPIHTAPATWLSTLFFADKRANFDAATVEQIEANLNKAASWFGIKAQTDVLKEKVAASAQDELNMLADDDFALVWRYDDGSWERHLPLRNGTEVKFAAYYLNRFRDEFVFADRYQIASRIMQKVAAYGALLDDSGPIEQMAGLGYCAASTAAELLEDRAVRVQRKHPDLGAELVKTAALVRAKSVEPRQAGIMLEQGTLVKLAATVDELDRFTGLRKIYDEGGLPRPEEVLFQVTEKVARAFSEAHIPMTTGNVYAAGDMEKLALEDVRNWMGDEFADAVSAGDLYVDGEKLAEILPTLDRGMATMFDRLMHTIQVEPAVREKQASNLLSRESLFALAAGYQPG